MTGQHAPHTWHSCNGSATQITALFAALGLEDTSKCRIGTTVAPPLPEESTNLTGNYRPYELEVGEAGAAVSMRKIYSSKVYAGLSCTCDGDCVCGGSEDNDADYEAYSSDGSEGPEDYIPASSDSSYAYMDDPRGPRPQSALADVATSPMQPQQPGTTTFDMAPTDTRHISASEYGADSEDDSTPHGGGADLGDQGGAGTDGLSRVQAMAAALERASGS